MNFKYLFKSDLANSTNLRANFDQVYFVKINCISNNCRREVSLWNRLAARDEEIDSFPITGAITKYIVYRRLVLRERVHLRS